MHVMTSGDVRKTVYRHTHEQWYSALGFVLVHPQCFEQNDVTL